MNRLAQSWQNHFGNRINKYFLKKIKAGFNTSTIMQGIVKLFRYYKKRIVTAIEKIYTGQPQQQDIFKISVFETKYLFWDLFWSICLVALMGNIIAMLLLDQSMSTKGIVFRIIGILICMIVIKGPVKDLMIDSWYYSFCEEKMNKIWKIIGFF